MSRVGRTSLNSSLLRGSLRARAGYRNAVLGTSFARFNSTFVELTTPNGITYNQPTGLFIDGDFVPSQGGKTFATESPSTESEIVKVSDATNEDAEKAVKAAEKAFKTWSQTPGDDRAIILNKIADGLEKEIDLFTAVEAWDNGKTVAMAKGDIQAAVATFRNYAGYANKIDGDVIETDPDHFTYVRREPIGVCGMIIPWNFPLLMLAWKIAPCLACGCSLVLKPAESTPLTALLFAKVCKDAGVPEGVVNILSGFGPVGGYLASHPRIHKIAFTGSTATGRKIMNASADSNLKKITLELGGKSANLIFEDADIETAIKGVILGIYYNSGEVCCAGSRLLVQESIYDKFIDALKTEVEKLTIGDPFDPNSFYGAQTSKTQFDKVLSYIAKGREEGARIVTGGHRKGDKGYFIEPTIFADVDNDKHTIAREEIFGPVLSVIKFKDSADAVRIANENVYGLAAGVFTENLNRAIYVANNLRAGSVWVNTYNALHHNVPFGGYGESGIGRELGKFALENFTEIKAVRIGGILRGAH